MAIIGTEAIILRSMDHRETSKLAFFFTRKCGRVIGVLKGIRKSVRKFGSSADKCTVNDIVYYQYANSDIHLVSQCDMKEFFPVLRENIKSLNAAEYACELLNKVMPLDEPNPAVYGLLLDFLRALNTLERSIPGEVSRLVHMFQIKVLSLSGFRPHIDACVRCGSGIPLVRTLKVTPARLKEAWFARLAARVIRTALWFPPEHWRPCCILKRNPGPTA
jgi:DNA repair protein RecO (recombination protein O)